MIQVSQIQKAKNRIDGIVNKTPFTYAPLLSKHCNTFIFLKKENLQLTGAYKLRGAYNKIASLSPEERARGVIAASAGNHAQGVAYSAGMFKIPSTIIMPEATPLLKVLSTKSFGANVILHGENYDEAYDYALKYSKKHTLTFIHPFADDEVIAGQGTVGLEMLDQMDDIDVVVIPIGGGGLISGIGSVFKQLKPSVKIIGVVASGADAMLKSFIAKKAIDSTSVRTIADGIAVRDVNEKNLSYILEVVDEIVAVDDEEIANAILFLLEKQKLVVEGAGAVGVAAIIGGIKYGEQPYNVDSSNSYLSMLLVAIGIAMVLPHFIDVAHHDMFMMFNVVMFILLYVVFTRIQLKSHKYFFEYEEKHEVCKEGEPCESHQQINAWYHAFNLILSIVLIGVLAEILSVFMGNTLESFELPLAIGAVGVAVISAAPELITAVRAAVDNRMQTVINIALGASLATILLTIPAVILVSRYYGLELNLSLTPVQGVMLGLTLLLSIVNFSDGETNVLEGFLHFILFVVFAFLLFV